MVRLFEVGPVIWEDISEAIDYQLAGFKGENELLYGKKAFKNPLHSLPDWRKHAHQRKIERELFEKYGHLKDFILNPYFQEFKGFYEERVLQNLSFSLFLGDPLLPLTTTIFLLFMINKRLGSNTNLFLLFAFIYQMNPFYISLVLLLIWLFQKKSSSSFSSLPKKHIALPPTPSSSSTVSERRHYQVVQQFNNAKDLFKRNEGASVDEDSPSLLLFDHVLIGKNISTLYCAALLSLNGHRCCVVDLSQSQKSEVSNQLAFLSIPVVIVTSFILFC
jgi:hypothetical protein